MRSTAAAARRAGRGRASAASATTMPLATPYRAPGVSQTRTFSACSSTAKATVFTPTAASIRKRNIVGPGKVAQHVEVGRHPRGQVALRGLEGKRQQCSARQRDAERGKHAHARVQRSHAQETVGDVAEDIERNVEHHDVARPGRAYIGK